MLWALTDCGGAGVDARESETRIMVMPFSETLYVSQSCGLQPDTPITTKEIGNQCWLTTAGSFEHRIVQRETCPAGALSDI